MPCESAKMRSSSPMGPTTCNPTGIPCGPSKAGIVTQGTCSSVQMRLNTEFETESISAIASPDVLGVNDGITTLEYFGHRSLTLNDMQVRLVELGLIDAVC